MLQDRQAFFSASKALHSCGALLQVGGAGHDGKRNAVSLANL